MPGYSVDYSGLRSHRNNDTAPPPELLVFMSVALASELSFHGFSPGFWSFSHINVLLTRCALLNRK